MLENCTNSGFKWTPKKQCSAIMMELFTFFTGMQFRAYFVRCCIFSALPCSALFRILQSTVCYFVSFLLSLSLISFIRSFIARVSLSPHFFCLRYFRATNLLFIWCSGFVATEPFTCVFFSFFLSRADVHIAHFRNY